MSTCVCNSTQPAQLSCRATMGKLNPARVATASYWLLLKCRVSTHTHTHAVMKPNNSVHSCCSIFLYFILFYRLFVYFLLSCVFCLLFGLIFFLPPVICVHITHIQDKIEERERERVHQEIKELPDHSLRTLDTHPSPPPNSKPAFHNAEG